MGFRNDTDFHEQLQTLRPKKLSHALQKCGIGSEVALQKLFIKSVIIDCAFLSSILYPAVQIADVIF